MTLGQWYVSRGRIPRRVFWLHYTLPILAATIVATMFDDAFGLWIVEPRPGSSAYTSGAGVLTTLVTLGLLVPSFSSQVTRLHDRNHSAWWLLLAFAPVLGWIVLLVQTWFLPGDELANRYGPPTSPAVSEPVHL